jgi:hypothetical protein
VVSVLRGAHQLLSGGSIWRPGDQLGDAAVIQAGSDVAKLQRW